MNNLTKCYKLNIHLKEISPPIWRTFIVVSGLNLAELHKIIKTIMGWTDNNSYRYIFREIPYGGFIEEYSRKNYKSLEEVTLKQLIKNKGDSFIYEYDFNQR